MAKRMTQRDNAREEYIARKSKGEKVNLRELAEKHSVSYQTVRNWKAADKWDSLLPPKKRGGQPHNKNSKGKKNAAGHHNGAPKGNKNAEKDGAYSAVFFDMLSDGEKELVAKTPVGSREALEHEMKILKFREHRVLSKIADYEKADEEALFLHQATDMGAVTMYHKDSAFARILKLQEALYKIQGRIAKIADSLRTLEESADRMTLEKEKLQILKIRSMGVVDAADIDIDDLEE